MASEDLDWTLWQRTIKATQALRTFRRETTLNGTGSTALFSGIAQLGRLNAGFTCP
jgi:hypothetical protein